MGKEKYEKKEMTQTKAATLGGSMFFGAIRGAIVAGPVGAAVGTAVGLVVHAVLSVAKDEITKG